MCGLWTTRCDSPRLAGRRVLMLVAVASALLLCSVASAARVRWHDSFEEALQAAKQSGKPIFAFVYLSQADLGEREGLEPSKQMLRETLTDDGVVAAARAFEAVKLDLRDPDSDAARRRLKVSPVSNPLGLDADTNERVAAYPISLFLDSHGDELFRRHGYLPPPVYSMQLQRAANLFEKITAVTEEPNDPVARREVGRAYMEMDFARGDPFYKAAVRNLEAAIKMDPENDTGAKFDAEVDLAILRLPDDPQKALTALAELEARDRDGHRRLEIQYYMAVAHYVLGDAQKALRLLERFETGEKDSEYYDSPWTPQALGLLKHIRRRVAGE
ncbi:MAG: hypothetical protein U9R79_05400 [Armatimonadota bacterium]|nr:hypothetical protein [Armatimonadota bacterium]